MSNDNRETMILFLNAEQTEALFNLQVDLTDAMIADTEEDREEAILRASDTYRDVMGPVFAAIENRN